MSDIRKPYLTDTTATIEELARRHGISQQAASDLYTLGRGEGLKLAAMGAPVRQSTIDVQKSLNGAETYRQAYGRGMTMSAWLEDLDPSEPGERLDAFQRQLFSLGVRARSSRELGVYASTLEDLYEAGNGVGATLVPEFIRRAWVMGAKYGPGVFKDATRFYASNNPVSDVLEPSWLDTTLRSTKLRASILDRIVALETGIDSGTFESFYLTESAADERHVRITQGGALPTVTLTGGEHTVRLKKFGRAIEFPYEVTRRWRLDLVQFHIARIAARSALDSEQVAVETIINGDGNSSTAATSYNLSTLGGTAGTIDAASLIKFIMKFKSPLYNPTVALGDAATVAKYLTTNIGSANLPMFITSQAAMLGQGGIADMPQFPACYQRDDYMPANKLLCVDGSQSLLRLFEVGSDITETDRIIRNQLDVVTLSITEGYSVIDQAAAFLLAWNA